MGAGVSRWKELDPRVADEVERQAHLESHVPERAGYTDRTREDAWERRGEVDPSSRSGPGDRSLESYARYRDRAEPRDDAVEDGG